jgi:hypothetical protein
VRKKPGAAPTFVNFRNRRYHKRALLLCQTNPGHRQVASILRERKLAWDETSPDSLDLNPVLLFMTQNGHWMLLNTRLPSKDVS